MTVSEFLALLRECPLVASVQASPGSPLDDPETLLKLAKASLSQGVKVLRLEGVENIKRIQGETGAVVIGLIKRGYPGSEVYITPTMREVDELLEIGCPVVAVDATPRQRPGEERLSDLAEAAHRVGRLVLGDCDGDQSLEHALSAGCDLVSTTLAGYTGATPATVGPDLETLRSLLAVSPVPVLAEGRFGAASQVQQALCLGAIGVVVGGAMNDPVKTTSSMLRGASSPSGRFGALDVGGTWTRWAVYEPDGTQISRRRLQTHTEPVARKRWLTGWTRRHGLVALGVSAGGTIDPATGSVLESKPIVAYGTADRWPGRALNDGLATAWGHACHPAYVGRRVFTLALGTGVGAGFVAGHRLMVGHQGQYPRLNDMPFEPGATVEDALGGRALERGSTDRETALRAARFTIGQVRTLFSPDVIVVCGGVGLSPWMRTALAGEPEVEFSPFGPDAGLMGARALAVCPPEGVFPE